MKSVKLTVLFCIGVIVLGSCDKQQTADSNTGKTSSQKSAAPADQPDANNLFKQGADEPHQDSPAPVSDSVPDGDKVEPAEGEPADALAEQTNTNGPKRLALLVGIDDYLSEHVPDLAGCVNDVYDFQQLLKTRFEFADEDILILTSGTDAERTTDPKPTHDAIVKAFQQHLIDQAEEDTVVVFQYSGHGSLMRDSSGDEIDGKDETIVPYDSRTEDVFDISDDELNGLFGQLSKKTKNVTFILDSCHSGSATRGQRSRTVDEDLREPPPAFPHARSSKQVDEHARFEDQNYVLISGCRPNESSYEYYDEQSRQERGAMTYFLTRVIRESRGEELTYRDVMDKVKGLVASASTAQHPQLEGGEPADIDRFLFDVATAVAEPYIIANPKGDLVQLAAGKIHGLTKGSEFDVYAPGTKKFDDARPVARIRLTSVDAYTAEGTPLGDAAAIENASRAIQRVHSFVARRFPVYIDVVGQMSFAQIVDGEEVLRDDTVADSAVLKQIRDHLALDEESKDSFEIAASPTQSQIRLSHHKDDMIYIRGGTIESPPVAATDEDAVERVVKQIKHWARWFNVLRISSPNSKLSADFEIFGDVRSAARTDEGFAKVFASEDEITISVKNNSEKPFYFAVIDLASDGSIAVVYPQEGRTEQLAAGKQWKETTEVYVPDDQESTTDYLKLIAFSQPVDIAFLTTDAAPKSGDAGNFPLAAAALKIKGVRPVKSEDWLTDMNVLKVIKR